MIRILELADPAQRSQAFSLRASAAPPATVAPAVSAIIAAVRARGDEAVRELTEKFDGPRLDDLFLGEH
jgi:histidinol dehydrogenase